MRSESYESRIKRDFVTIRIRPAGRRRRAPARGTSHFRGMVASLIAGYLSDLARTVSEREPTMLENLESRTLFAAPLADASSTPTPEASTALNFTKGDITSLNFTKIKFDT